ncbi:MAG: recombinase family protein [Patescibacteria group bacterium]
MSIKSIALCRVSTLEQKIEGNSLERQESSVKKASELLDAPIVKQWSVDQSSRAGKNLARKDLKQAFEFCKANRQVKYLLVDEVDRFMRCIKEFYWYEVEFEKLGVIVYYASSPELNENTTAAKVGKLLKILQAEMSNDERAGKSLRGLKARVSLGYWPFPLHQGYAKGTEDGFHIPDPARFGSLQKAFREVLTQRYTVNEAFARLTNQGYTAPSGKLIRIDIFRRLLKDPYYAGALRVKTWDKELWNDKGLHKAMITLEEWEELQLIVDNKMRKFQRKQHNPKYPLSNLFYCGDCLDKKIVGYDHRNGKNNWIGEEYRCRGCHKVIKKQNAHEWTDELLGNIEMVESNTEGFKNALRRVWTEQQKDSFSLLKQLNIRLAKLKDEKTKLAEGVISHPDIAEELKESIEKKKAEIVELEKEITETGNIENDFIEFVEFSVGYIKELKTNWWGLEHADKIECKLLISKQDIFINSVKKVYTPEISPILKLIRDIEMVKNDQKNDMVELRGVAPLSKR